MSETTRSSKALGRGKFDYPTRPVLHISALSTEISTWLTKDRLDFISECTGLIAFLMAAIPAFWLSLRVYRAVKLRPSGDRPAAPTRKPERPAEPKSAAVDLNTVLTRHMELLEKLERLWSAKMHWFLSAGLFLGFLASLIKAYMAYTRLP